MACAMETTAFVDDIYALLETAGDDDFDFDRFGALFEGTQEWFYDGVGSDQHEELRTCERTFPNLYRGFVAGIFNWIDACAQVSWSSSTTTDDRCLDRMDTAADGFDPFGERMLEVLEWLDETD